MKRSYRMPGRNGGFSLIEVMIAVVVLATGLLALAALQGSLAKSSGEAKVRGRVASLLTARMDELRVLQYDSAATVANDSCAGTVWVPATFCAEAGLGALTTTQTVTTWSSEVDAAAFTEGRVPDAGEPQFKRVTLTATWADADNASHQLSMTSEISALALGSSLLPQPPGSGSPTGSPIVRTDNPAGPGVIPIAVGGGDATAASNPRPEVIGKNNNQSAVGTRFDVLTYSGLTGEAVIQRRVETSVIGCQCQYGTGGTNLPVIYRTAQWPAVWTGERYEIYTPDPTAAAPGTAYSSGPAPGVEQSPLCQECCRDHHDGTTANVAKFDPERVATELHEHYSPNGAQVLVKVPDTASATYTEACRLIRVDGFWRTAADTYSRHMGLLATETVSNKPAKTGLPDAAAALSYQTFVKDYLGQYTGTVGTAPVNGSALFDEPERLLNTPVSISIDRPSPKDERYLHARGVYVDYLEKDAREKIQAVLDKCPVNADQTECMLPYLPFSTINVTELAFWLPKKADVNDDLVDDTTSISVATGSSLIFDPVQPTRGRTNALATASGGAEAFAEAGIGLSNAGLAVTGGVDTADLSELTDAQEFTIAGTTTTPGEGDDFSARVSGLPQVLDTNTSNDPAIAWSIGTEFDNCIASIKLNNPGKDLDPNDYACNTFGTLGGAGSLTVANYFRETTVATESTTIFAQCHLNGVLTTVEASTVQVPALVNYVVSSATINGVAATAISAANDGTRSEATTISFASIPAGATAAITFATQTADPGSPILAEFVSCTATQANGNNKPVLLNTIVWDYSAWE